MATRYRADLCESVNEKTGVSRYYLSKCGAYQRITCAEHTTWLTQADTYENLHTRISRGVKRFYTTVVWEE